MHAYIVGLDPCFDKTWGEQQGSAAFAKTLLMTIPVLAVFSFKGQIIVGELFGCHIMLQRGPPH